MKLKCLFRHVCKREKIREIIRERDECGLVMRGIRRTSFYYFYLNDLCTDSDRKFCASIQSLEERNFGWKDYGMDLGRTESRIYT